MSTRIGIVGYGNIGKGIELALTQNSDMELVGIFTRRDPNSLETKLNSPVYHYSNVKDYVNKIDVMILCGGSATDLPSQGPHMASMFNTVDSYDNHDEILNYRASMNKAALNNKNTSIISTGWDPGDFSDIRVGINCRIIGAKVYGFYGLGKKGGLSMGHSDASRRVNGVIDARQYTHAIHKSIKAVRSGKNPELTRGEMHWREVFVVVENNSDRKRIKNEIISMPGYFEPYKTKVKFVTQKKLNKIHANRGMYHDGIVIGVGKTAGGNKSVIEYKNEFESNPESTANIMINYARACHKMNQEGSFGAKNTMDVPISYKTPMTFEELIAAHMI
jgi:diaminopimelate dehydrogenase